jgi:transposase
MWTVRARLQALGSAARRSDDLAADDRDARDAAIEQASLEGLSVREIAEDVGMSKSTVQQIILKRTAARQAQLADAAGLGGPPVGPSGRH